MLRGVGLGGGAALPQGGSSWLENALSLASPPASNLPPLPTTKSCHPLSCPLYPLKL